MNIEIKNRYDEKIILCGEYESIKDCLEKNCGANLSRVDLFGANLSRADLSGANLSGANLSRVDLSGANLSRVEYNREKLDKIPIQVLGLKYQILITKEQIKIGCELHKSSEWEKFKDSRIKLMDKEALEWWKANKKIIMGLHKNHCNL